MDYRERYQEWCESGDFDEATKKELEGIRGDEEEIKDRFYQDLEFGTGGLRGVIGAGTNRMNLYTVGRATQRFAWLQTGSRRTVLNLCARHQSCPLPCGN